MRIVKAMAALGVAAALTLAPVDAAQAAVAVNCTDNYLLCLNDASQESGWFWRTAMEFECGLEYYGCLADKTTGS